MEERIQKFLANQGICSRRKAEEAILLGKIKVNGKIISELGTKINPEVDNIEYEGKNINKKIEKVYILLNKPIGYITTVKDQFGRPTVMNVLQEKGQKLTISVVPVGRLDMYTSGALILSNDGDFIYRLTHPKHEINKTYQVTLKGKIAENEVEKLKNGVDIGDYITKPAQVRIMKIDEDKDISRIELTIHEGKNRQVRRMCEVIGKKVLALHRSKIGDINVKDLKLGQWRYLRKTEVEKLLENSKL
jgi:23S rRNA pseudouridine2605 synthase